MKNDMLTPWSLPSNLRARSLPGMSSNGIGFDGMRRRLTGGAAPSHLHDDPYQPGEEQDAEHTCRDDGEDEPGRPVPGVVGRVVVVGARRRSPEREPDARHRHAHEPQPHALRIGPACGWLDALGCGE